MLRPIKLLPARERVASVLRKAILTKELPEGEVITLEGIASQLEVSNTPVREAFQILARDGFIRLRHNKGADVLGITSKFIRDHYETRAILEQAATGIVCCNNADLSEIEEAYYCGKEVVDNKTFTNYSNYNQAFHMAIWTAANNEKMVAILSEMWNGLSLGQNVTEEEYATVSSAEHSEILKAIQARNESLARQLMYRHIIRSMHDMLTRFE